jgi:hypothetical protein
LETNSGQCPPSFCNVRPLPWLSLFFGMCSALVGNPQITFGLNILMASCHTALSKILRYWLVPFLSCQRIVCATISWTSGYIRTCQPWPHLPHGNSSPAQWRVLEHQFSYHPFRYIYGFGLRPYYETYSFAASTRSSQHYIYPTSCETINNARWQFCLFTFNNLSI